MNATVTPPLSTHFAPAERLSAVEVAAQVAELGSRGSLKQLLNTIPSFVLILNGEPLRVAAPELCLPGD
jgi:hypothetical protein